MPHHILIVDDSATTRAIIRRIIKLCGTATGSIFDARDGQEALDILGKEQIDLVLADLHMPVMGGLEMTQRMQADARLKEIPVIVISADPNLAHLEQLKLLGVRGHLSKPFTPEGFRDAIGDLLGVPAHA